MNDKKQELKKQHEFFENVASLIEQARSFAGRTVDLTMGITYFEVGRMIVEEEQGGKAKAKYGTKLLEELSQYLKKQIGRGFSATNLRNARKFYLTYQHQIQQTRSGISIQQMTSAEFNPFKLGWSHYQILMRIKDENARNFYEIESIEQQWSVEELKRNYHSSLYERLALSRDKEAVMRLSQEGQKIKNPKDMIKNPLFFRCNAFLSFNVVSKQQGSISF